MLIFAKFVWDTYVTGETEKQYQINKKRNPEESARMENKEKKGKYFDFDYSPRTNSAHRIISLQILANKFDCNEGDVKEKFLDGILKLITTSNLSNNS